jgi:hypothetical protein
MSDFGLAVSYPGVKGISEHGVRNSGMHLHRLAPAPSLSEGTISDSPPSTLGRSAASLEEGTISTSASSYRSLQHVTKGESS